MPSIAIDSKESQKILSKLVAQTWLDEEFKKRFVLEPRLVLEENGLTLSSSAHVRVNEDASLESITSMDANIGSNLVYEIPLPLKPDALMNESIQSQTKGHNSEDFEPNFCF